MRRVSILAGAAALLILPAAALSASVPHNSGEIRANSEVERLWADPAIRAALEEMAAEYLKPGEPVDEGKPTVDLRAAVANAPGGIPGNYVLSVDGEGERFVSTYAPVPVAAFIPNEWKLVSSFGSIDETLQDAGLGVGSIDDGYYVVVRADIWIEGKNECGSRIIGAQLYKGPGTQSEESAELAHGLNLAFTALTAAMDGKTVCTRYYPQTDGSYKAVLLLPDGRSLGKGSDPEERITIVPVEPLEALLGLE